MRVVRISAPVLQATLQQPPRARTRSESMSPAHLTASGVTCCARHDVATAAGELRRARHAGSIRTTDADLARLFSWVVRSGSRSRAAGSPTVSSGCTDSLATNHDPRALAESGDCEYDCARLSAHYFARPARGGANRTTRCFLYDKKKRAWSVNLNTAHSLPFVTGWQPARMARTAARYLTRPCVRQAGGPAVAHQHAPEQYHLRADRRGLDRAWQAECIDRAASFAWRTLRVRVDGRPIVRARETPENARGSSRAL